jgi:hypothetical protein
MVIYIISDMINQRDTTQTRNLYKQRLLKIMREVMESPAEEKIERAKSLCQKNQSVHDDVYYVIDETEGINNSELHVYSPMKFNDIGMFYGEPKYPHFQYHISKLDNICSIMILDPNSIETQ